MRRSGRLGRSRNTRKSTAADTRKLPHAMRLALSRTIRGLHVQPVGECGQAAGGVPASFVKRGKSSAAVSA